VGGCGTVVCHFPGRIRPEYRPKTGHHHRRGEAVFVQIISGKVDDESALQAALDRWVSDLAGEAIGWLGTTAGVTDDGTFLAVARFDNEEAARENSDRPEQDQWWSETSQLFRGEASFAESSDVDLDLMGDPDDAGFVQVIRSKVTDPSRVRELMKIDVDDFRDFRPDILGTLTATHDDGVMTTVAYFTSEEEARAGEQKEPTAEMMAVMQEVQQLGVGEPEYFDLRRPWLASPGG
jgi:hypothetical protein